MDKFLGIVNFLGANGAGRSNASSGTADASWLTEALAWLGDAVVKIATVVWGWLINIFYLIVKWCLNLIDVLQMFIEKLVGIDVYNQEGGLSAVKDIKDTDLIIRFITNETILKTFRTIMILGIILLIIFSILAIVKQNYQSAITDGADGAKKTPRDVLKFAGRAIFMCLLVPFLLVFGILGSNAVLASICNSIKGDNDLTIGGLIFTASAYEANKFREYASDGLRVPITTSGASEVVYPADYSSDADMQELFYKLAKGTVYISAISDDQYFKDCVNGYTWLNGLELEDVQVDASKLMGSADFNQFVTDFNGFYDYYFDNEPLSEFNMFSDIIKSVYTSNWTNNKKYVDVTFDFSSTYITQKELEFSTRATINSAGVAEIATHPAKIIVNTQSYNAYENFAPIELEYYVMADLIDYAIEQNKTFYYVNASHESIKWSDIVLNSKKPDEKINIEEYNDKFMIVKNGSDTGVTYNGSVYSENQFGTGGTLESYAKSLFSSAVEVVSDSAFIVRYYNGVNRLYWSETGATSENDGATYIICTKDAEGNYIPVTQTTSKFRSAFLAEDYGGPIVARGIFQEESLIPKDYCLPTAISEQVVDDDGNELIGFERNSPFSISDSYQESENIATAMSSFCGTLHGFVASPLLFALEHIFAGANSAYQNWAQSVMSNLVAELNETKSTDTYTEDLLINPNISGFTYSRDANNNPKTVTFYDYNGRKITAGSGYKEADRTEFDIETGSGIKKEAYILLQKEMFTDIVIPWYFTDASNLSSLISAIIGSNGFNMDGYSFLLAKYTYDNIKITLKDTDNKDVNYRMLLNFNITEIAQVYRGANTETSATSGEFIVTNDYPTLTASKIHVEKKASLVVSGGEIYYANGTKFFGKEDAKKLYTNYITDYIIDGLTTSISNYIDGAVAYYEYKKVVELLNKNGATEDARREAFVKTLSQAEQEAYNNATGAEQKLAILNRNGYSESSKTAPFRASDFRAGLAAMITEYDKSYYSTTESSEAGGISGVMKFYDKNNREITSEEVSYKTKNNVTDPKVSVRVALVGGADNSSVPSYSVVVKNNTKQVNASVGNDATLIHNLAQEFLAIELDAQALVNRRVWYYDITYSLNYYEYKDSSDKVVAITNVSLDNLDIKYIGSAKANETLVLTTNPANPNFLKVKNNGVYCEALGKYVLTTDGMKNYMSCNTENGGNKVATVTKTNENGGADDITDSASLKLMDSKTLSARSRSEYNNVYTYFSRGNFSWTMLLDFSIHLPTISFNPFQVKFVFRFKLGSAYNYTEKVLYRLQGGMFYLDYNFRQSTGIGMQNLFRMGAINPFILIFSTVLVLGIIWRTVWGLIRRIYDIVLLFILLPAVCSTMPMDEGGRFTNWRKELVEQVFAAYSVLITLNIYFVLVPIVKDVTSDLITMGDLPTTITGMFSSIATGATGFGATIRSISSGFVGAITSVGSKFGQLLSNIGIGNFILDSDLTTAQQSILGHVNSIVYTMFFLVLTTMLSNGKALIEKILELSKLEEGTLKEVQGNLKDVTAKATAPVNAAAKGAKLIAGKARDGIARFSNRPGRQSDKPGMLAGDTPSPPSSETPEMAGLPGGENQGSGEPQGAVAEATNTNNATPVPENDDKIALETPAVDASGEAVDYGFVTPGESFDAMDKKYGGDMDAVDADISDLNDMKADEVESVRNEAVEYGAVNKDGSYMSLNQYDQAIRELKNTIDDARTASKQLDAEREQLQKEGKFNGEAKADWTDRNNKNNEKKTKAEQELSKMQAYEGSYTTQREKEADIRAQYDKEIDNLEDYKKTKTTNEQAQARLEEDATKAGLSTEDYSHMNDLYKERDGLEEMKKSVDETFDTEEEREGARAEIEKELNRIADEIIAIKTKAIKEAYGGVDGYQAEEQEKSLQNLGVNLTPEQLKEMTVDELRDEIDARYKTSQQAIMEEINASIAKYGSDEDLEKTINSATATDEEKATAQAELDMRKGLAEKRDKNTKDYANAVQTQMDRDSFKEQKRQEAKATQQAGDTAVTTATNEASGDATAQDPNAHTTGGDSASATGTTSSGNASAQGDNAQTTSGDATAQDPNAHATGGNGSDQTGDGTQQSSGDQAGAGDQQTTSDGNNKQQSGSDGSDKQQSGSGSDDEQSDTATDPNAGKQTSGTQDPGTDANNDAGDSQDADANQQQTTAPKKKSVGKKVKKVVKGVGIGVGVAAAALVAPAPAVMAVVGGKLAVKGGKALKNSKLGKAVNGKVSSVNNYLGNHPKAKAFAKNAAITIGLSAVTPFAGMGYVATKFVKSKVGKKKNQNNQTTDNTDDQQQAGGQNGPGGNGTQQQTGGQNGPGGNGRQQQTGGQNGPGGNGSQQQTGGQNGPGGNGRQQQTGGQNGPGGNGRQQQTGGQNGPGGNGRQQQAGGQNGSGGNTPPPPPPGGNNEDIESLRKEVEKVKTDIKTEISKAKTDTEAELDKLGKKIEKVEKNATDVEVQLKRSNLKQEQVNKRNAQNAEAGKNTAGSQAESQKVQEQISALEKKIAQSEAKTKATVKAGVENVDKKVDKVQRDVDFITDYAGGLEDEIKKVKASKSSSSTRERMKDFYQDASSGGQEMVKNASENLAKHRAETEAKNPLNKNKK